MPVSTTPIFPHPATTRSWPFRGMPWKVFKEAQNKTDLTETDSGRTAARARWATPKWRFELRFTNLRDRMGVARNAAKTGRAQELEQLLQFLLARRGSFEPFFFTDPTDHNVTSDTGHVIATAPGGLTDFPLTRPFGIGGFVEPIGGLNEALTYTIRVNGTPASVTPNTPYDGWVRFAVAPSAADVITGDFSHYFKLRFKTDLAAFQTIAKDFWALDKLEMVSDRR